MHIIIIKYKHSYFDSFIFTNFYLIFKWLYFLSSARSINLNDLSFVMILEKNQYLNPENLRFEISLQKIKNILEKKNNMINIHNYKYKFKEGQTYEYYHPIYKIIKKISIENENNFIISNSNNKSFHSFYKIDWCICIYCGCFSCTMLHTSPIILEYLLLSKWINFGPHVYISLPMQLKNENCIMILDKKLNILYLSFENRFLSFPQDKKLIELCLDIIPHSYEPNTVISLQSYCYKILWNYNILNVDTKLKHTILKDLYTLLPNKNNIILS